MDRYSMYIKIRSYIQSDFFAMSQTIIFGSINNVMAFFLESYLYT